MNNERLGLALALSLVASCTSPTAEVTVTGDDSDTDEEIAVGDGTGTLLCPSEDYVVGLNFAFAILDAGVVRATPARKSVHLASYRPDAAADRRAKARPSGIRLAGSGGGGPIPSATEAWINIGVTCASDPGTIHWALAMPEGIDYSTTSFAFNSGPGFSAIFTSASPTSTPHLCEAAFAAMPMAAGSGDEAENYTSTMAGLGLGLCDLANESEVEPSSIVLHVCNDYEDAARGVKVSTTTTSQVFGADGTTVAFIDAVRLLDASGEECATEGLPEPN